MRRSEIKNKKIDNFFFFAFKSWSTKLSRDDMIVNYLHHTEVTVAEPTILPSLLLLNLAVNK